MIARIWHGITPIEKSEEYTRFLNRVAVRDYAATPGNLGVRILRRVVGDQAHFLTVTFWESYASIKGFAGEDLEKARYYPEDQDFLLEFEEYVTHYEMVGRAQDAETGGVTI